MLQKSCSKVAPKFYCEDCDYTTSKSSSFKKHLSTAKHINLTNLTEKVAKVAPQNEIYICDICEKQYKSRMGGFVADSPLMRTNDPSSFRTSRSILGKSSL